tara:strand:- start:2932 stop:3186 length:255 start_codon:yes stop_codon:yes gene_type:complete
MALKMFKNKKVSPKLGDLVRPRMIADMTGIVVEIRDNEEDVESEYYKNEPRKIFVVRWMHGHAWAKQSIKTEYQAHQLEVISKA